MAEKKFQPKALQQNDNFPQVCSSRNQKPFGTKSLDMRNILFPDIVWSIIDRSNHFTWKVFFVKVSNYVQGKNRLNFLQGVCATPGKFVMATMTKYKIYWLKSSLKNQDREFTIIRPSNKVKSRGFFALAD